MKNTELQSTEQLIQSPEDEIDPLSVFLQEYAHYAKEKPDHDNDMVQEVRKGIKKLNEILEGLNLPEKKNLMTDWITSDQVKFKLGIAERTLAGWRKNGKLPYARIENKFYYKSQDLEILLLESYQGNKKQTGKL